MVQRTSLVVAAVCLASCAAQSYTDNEDVAPDGVARVASALGDNDENDFRKRKTENKPFPKRKEDCGNDPRVTLGLVSANICTGADLFFREPFGGNGRACGTCHTAQFDFTISPEFIASLAPDDPLFVAESNPALAQLERPDLMRSFGLILENVDGADAPTTKFVMRSVPHTFSLKTSVTPVPVVNSDGTGVDGTTQPPSQRTGWGGDGAPSPGGLKQFQTGAVFQHYTKSLNRLADTDFVVPTDEQLSRIEEFLLSIGRSSDVSLADVTLTDTGAEAGRTKFLGSRCNGCHRNAGANNAAGFNRNFDTGIETVRLAELNTQNIPHDGGFGGGAAGAPFNHDSDHDGTNDSYGNGTFSTPPLIEAADTAPFFHSNSHATIEDAVAFYTTTAFANSAAGGGAAIALSADEIANIAKLLRVLNASFNCKLAAARLDAAARIADAQGNHYKGLQFGLLDAAQAEVRDALADLAGASINANERAHLSAADQALTDAFANSSPKKRHDAAQLALTEVQAADGGLGTGLSFTVGAGSIMF